MLYLVLVFGLIAGSLLNVMIYRLKSGEPIGLSRSFCPDCRTQLKWYDLVPILSFIYLCGRCRYCRKKISWQYPVVEILSGLIWLGVFYQNFNNNFSPFGEPPEGWQFLNFFYSVFILSALLIIAFYDAKWQIIPDKIVYPTIAAALVFIFFKSFQYSLFIASTAFLFFFLIYYFSKGRAMGLGDAKLAFLIGLFLNPLSATIAFMLAFVLGAVSGIILIGFGQIFSRYKKWGMKSQIAFGPFLVLGATLAFFFSDFIFQYLNI